MLSENGSLLDQVMYTKNAKKISSMAFSSIQVMSYGESKNTLLAWLDTFILRSMKYTTSLSLIRILVKENGPSQYL